MILHPAIAATVKLRSLSGLEALQALVAGDLPPPPMLQLLSIRLLSAERGEVRAALTPDESMYSLLGMTHGGALATLLDTVLGCAVHTTLAAGRGYATLNIGVSYVRPLTIETGEVIAEAHVVHSGRTTGIARAKVLDASGKLYATGETTCMIFDWK